MNVNKKIVLAAIGGVLLLLFIFAAIMLFRGIRQFGDAEKKLAAARTTLDGFYRKKPFPSAENVKIVKDNVDQTQGWIRDITDVAKRKQVEPDSTKSPSVFINLLAKVRNGLQSKAKQSGVTINEDFGFGFDRYVEGQPATADYVPRLIQQLMIINGVCNVLIDEKVKEINVIGREQFDGVRAAAPVLRRGNAGAAPHGPVVAGLQPASSIAATPANALTGEFTDEKLDSKMRFTFEFYAKEASLMAILNKLAQHEMFIVITSVDIQGSAPVEKAASPGGAAAAAKPVDAAASLLANFGVGVQTPAATAEAKKPAFKREPSREERVIFGGRVEQPARVRIELEVYRFK